MNVMPCLTILLILLILSFSCSLVNIIFISSSLYYSHQQHQHPLQVLKEPCITYNIHLNISHSSSCRNCTGIQRNGFRESLWSSPPIAFPTHLLELHLHKGELYPDLYYLNVSAVQDSASSSCWDSSSLELGLEYYQPVRVLSSHLHLPWQYIGVCWEYV